MTRGRNKKTRKISLDVNGLICSRMGPLEGGEKVMKKLERIRLDADEVQALKYRDLDRITMHQAAKKMGISKTVFAGIYTSARMKQTDCLINGKILMIKSAVTMDERKKDFTQGDGTEEVVRPAAKSKGDKKKGKEKEKKKSKKHDKKKDKKSSKDKKKSKKHKK